MFRLVVVLACVAAAIAASRPLDGRVVGGSDAAPGQFPYQISLRVREDNKHTCGGTIIANRFVVTAAHCVNKKSLEEYVIVVGTNSLSAIAVAYDIDSAVIHEYYDDKFVSYDIAIIKVTQDISFSATVQPIPLQQSEIPDLSTVVLSGWGYTSWPSEGDPPDTLQYVNLNTMDIMRCAQALAPSPIFTNQICTLTGPGLGYCAGDLGGPLVYQGRLAGVASWGRLCATGLPDVFTKVSSFVNWIQRTMQTM